MSNRPIWLSIFLCALVGIAPHAQGASTGSTNLLTPQTNASGTANGDYISASLDTAYHYWIEVPPSQARLLVEAFDADLGNGGATEDTAGRDRDRTNGTSWGTVTYTVLNPAGSVRATVTGNNTGPGDNAWSTLLDTTGDNFRDNFGTNAYTNNDGSVNWATNWLETNDDNNATNGQMRVTGGELRLGDNGDANPSSIAREANLTGNGITSATLSFNLRTTGVEATDQFAVQISANGGTSYTTLETFTGTIAATTRSYNITSSIASNTRVRFLEITGYGANDFLFIDNLEIKAGNVQAGHWELRLDMSTASANDGTQNNINAVGIRASDGDTTSGGTEFNIYYDSHNQIGINPPAAGSATRTYSFYPYLTSGCSAAKNDFDYDSNSGNVGSMAFASRTGTFTQNYTTASLSTNDTWRRDTFSGWTSDTRAGEYGIWSATISINTYNTPGINGNYANIYFTNFQAAANPPTANPGSNTFRVYFPTDAGGTPVKPYLDQQLTFTTGQGGLSGPNPPVVGQTSKYTVTVRVVNPTAQAITFSASNLVTANIPGAGAVYGGNPQVSQGSVVSQPSVGGTGNLTWNPGTLAAGATGLLSYIVNVTPTSAGQRITTTATPASGNGTRAQWVDETGNTTQARATYAFGPLCELAVTQGLLTPAVVSDVRATAGDDGVAVEWSTASEVGAVSFDVLRYDRGAKRWVAVSEQSVPALVGAQQGGHYRLLDPGAPVGGVASYMIVEHDNAGETRRHGPFRVRVAAASPGERALRVASGKSFSSAAKPLKASPQLAPPAAAQQLKTSIAAARATQSTVQVAARVTERGVYRIAAQDIADILGLPLTPVRKDIASHMFRMTNAGDEVAWFAGANYDSLLFYGEASASPFSNENLYLLRRRFGVPPSEPLDATTSPTEAAVRAEVHAEQQKLGATVVATDPRSDFWYWDYVYAGDATAGTRAFSVEAPLAVAGGADALLTVNLKGATSTGVTDEHHAIVRVNGTEVGELRFTGFEAATAELAVRSSLLGESNTVSVEGVLDSGAAFSIFYVDSFDLSYDRVAVADGGSLFFGGSLSSAVTIGGFASPDINVWDLSDPRHPAPVSGTVSLRRVGSTVSLATAPNARYVAFVPSAARQPALRALVDTQLLSPSLAADEVILAPALWLDTVQPLADWRRAQGLKVEVVSLQDVWDGFGYGMPDPLAIRSFLAATRSNWSQAPRYVLLAGGGTFDYRDYSSLGGNFVPPMLVSTANGLFASDPSLADFDGDGTPEMEVGRLPVSSPAELADAIEKTIDYESSPGAAWVGRALLLADADAQTDFARDGNLIGGRLGDAYDVNTFELRTEPIQAAHGRLIGALNSGAGLMNFVGHGGLDRFSSLGLLTSDDVQSLNNGHAAPVVTAFTCMVNRFELPGVRPLGAYLADRRGGGAVAVLAPTALSRSELGRDFGQAFYRVFADGGERLGDVIAGARTAMVGEADAATFLPLYNLLGDPALLLQRPTAHGGGPASPPGE